MDAHACCLLGLFGGPRYGYLVDALYVVRQVYVCDLLWGFLTWSIWIMQDHDLTYFNT
jgi:hypothetical protein